MRAVRRQNVRSAIAFAIELSQGPQEGITHAVGYRERPAHRAILARIAVAGRRGEHLKGELNAMLAFVESCWRHGRRGRAHDLGYPHGDEESARTLVTDRAKLRDEF